MGIVFHDGTNSLFTNYCQGKAWNDNSLLQNQQPWQQQLNTETRITNIIIWQGSNSSVSEERWQRVQEVEGSSFLDYRTVEKKKKEIVTIDFASVVKGNNSLNVYVIKGIHQFHPQNRTHFSVAFDGFLWHMYVNRPQYDTWLVTHVSRGECFTRQDTEGFTTGKAGKGTGKLKKTF